jgi:hypothetical protein
MVAGFRLQVDIVRMNQASDDDVGGAVYTGTTVYECIPAAVEFIKPTFSLLEQGLQTRRLAQVLLQPQTLVIEERDEVLVVGPVGHADVGNRFRVISVQPTGLSPMDSRRSQVLTCERFEDGRTQQ